MLQRQIVSKGPLSMDHYFLCTYLPVTSGKDELSKSLLRFKSRLEVDHKAWLECCLQELTPLVSEDFLIVRALHHSESVITFSGLDKIGVELAQKTGCIYHPDWLFKTRFTKPLKSLRKADRSSELKNVYQFKPKGDVDGKQLLIIDDILTTGTTAFAVAQAVLDVYPQVNVTTFTLARVDYDTQLNESLNFYNDLYHWERNAGWQLNEMDVQYNALQNLKRKILLDAF